jgi:Zn-dependent metalloprotease
MKKNRNELNNYLSYLAKRIATGLTAVLICTATADAQNKNRPEREAAGTDASQIIAGAEYVKKGVSEKYLPSFVKLSSTTRITAGNIRSFVNQNVRAEVKSDLKLVKQETDELGMEHLRYQQIIKGIPVEQSTYIFHLKNGFVTSFNGEAVKQEMPDSKPSLSVSDVLSIAKRAVPAERYMWEDAYWEKNIKERRKDPNATYFPKAELCWYAKDFNVPGKDPVFRLAYKLDIYAASPSTSKRLYIDAKTGSVLNTIPLESNCSAATVNTVFNGSRSISTDKYTATNFRLKDDCQAATIRIRDWNSATCTNAAIEIENTTNTWTTQDERFGGSVLWAAKNSYNYWKNVRSRNSYDNANGSVEGYINAVFSTTSPACTPYTDNASMSFTGGTLKVGLGSAGTLANSWGPQDIIGHEYTHAVTGSSAALTYQDESGALNESFSDIFGEATEAYILGGPDWLVGADRSSGHIRSMSNPNSKNDPDTYLGTNWYSGTNDNGGVHTNSGVQNFWFYLLVNGGSGTNDNSDAYSVSGIGLSAASAIAARSLTQYLTSSSNYSDARTNSIQAAIDLYGSCSNEVKQTTNAWYAVGVGARFFDATASVTSNYNGRDVSCHNVCDGSATVSVISGILPTYSWSTGASTPSVSNLCPGNYTVTVTNVLGLGCSVTKSVTIQNTPLLTISPAVTSNYNGFGVSCFGGNNGTASANPSGGTTPYSYNWSNGQTTNNATGLSATSYTITVTDVNGCSASGGVLLTQPPQLSSTAAPTSNYNGYNVRCHGGADGTAEAYPSGGVPPYGYSWSNGQTTKIATGLSATTYTVTITDANGCTTGSSVTLNEPPQLSIEAGANKIVYRGYPDSSCAMLTYSGQGGGVPPYSIVWSTSSTATSINVCPIATTTYYVTITDANNCSFTDSVKVCVIDVRCGKNLDKVVLCHQNSGSSNPLTVCTSVPDAKDHFINHPGDQLAACGTVKVCEFPAAKIAFDPGMGETTSDKTYFTSFPNPFNQFATVRFRLPADQQINIRVYDLLGRNISLLFDGTAAAGRTYDIPFDGTSLPAGVYSVIMRTGTSEYYTTKMILNK